MPKLLKKHFLSGIFLLSLLLCSFFNPLSSTQFLLSDLFSQQAGSPSSNIYIIGIDDKTLASLGPWNNWPRSTMARLINTLNADADTSPSVIGIDVMYFGETASDEELFRTASRYHNLVFASQLQFSASLQRSDHGAYYLNPLSLHGIELPQAPLDVLADHGFTNVFLDSDGIVRRSMLTADYLGKTYDSFPYAVCKKYASSQHLEAPSVKTDKNMMWALQYSAAPGTYQQGISFIDVLEGKIPASYFKDSIVLIGAYSSGMMDSYLVPVSRNNPMYGVEINANMIQSLLEHKTLAQVPLILQLLVYCILYILCFYFYGKKETIIKNTCFAVSTFGWLAFTGICSRFGILWDMLYLPLFSFLYYILMTILDYLSERRERLLTQKTFERYVSPEVAAHLLSGSNSGLSSMKERRRHIAVLFVDIRGFTPLSESLEPEEVADILNEYLTLTSSCIFANNGTVDKFIGDATMALFNAPNHLEDYVFCAVKTALDILSGGKQLQETIMVRYDKKVQFGIGVHCGDAIIGSIGAPFRMDYTAIGDTVNTAARLESIAAPDQVLISKEVYSTLKDRVNALYLGSRPVKGKSLPVEIYQVLSIK